MKKKVCGVYLIRCKVNGKCRIGHASDIKRRWSQYLAELRHGKFYSEQMQHDFDTFGEENFEFLILEECPKFKCRELENFYIIKYNAIENGYNSVLNNVDKQKKIRRGWEAKRWKEKRSKLTRGAKNGNAQNSENVIVNIKRDILNGLTNKQIAKIYGKSENYISQIRIGYRWKHIIVPENTNDNNAEQSMNIYDNTQEGQYGSFAI